MAAATLATDVRREALALDDATSTTGWPAEHEGRPAPLAAPTSIGSRRRSMPCARSGGRRRCMDLDPDDLDVLVAGYRDEASHLRATDPSARDQLVTMAAGGWCA
ncbi:MAG: hypothetical protein R2702_10180 [Acidimicrobiales bacterium]